MENQYDTGFLCIPVYCAESKISYMHFKALSTFATCYTYLYIQCIYFCTLAEGCFKLYKGEGWVVSVTCHTVWSNNHQCTIKYSRMLYERNNVQNIHVYVH